MSDLVTFSDLAAVVYCPRKLYYRRRAGDRGPPPAVERVRELAFAYPELLAADLDTRPIDRPPDEYRQTLRAVRDRVPAVWAELVDPAERNVLVEGRAVRGYVSKVLALDVPTPTLVSAGTPPDDGVWEPQAVRAVAAAKALSWRERTPVERAFVEFPAHGVVREVRVTTRRKATYRRTLRAVRAIDGPPPRVRNAAKCRACEYRETCGVQTRSLRSLLGL